MENGMGGPDAKAKEKWLVQAIEEYFAKNANLHPDEVEFVLASILDTEFDTIIEDGSVAQVR
ncbi:unnamed protein product, partial [Ixodes hexagonus]